MLRNLTSKGGPRSGLRGGARSGLRGRASGPDRGALSGTLTGVSFIAGVGGALIRADDPYPRPGSTAADIQHYFTQNAGAARWSVAGQLVSAASLARFTGSVVRLAGRSGAGSRALQAAAAAGGALATASLGTAALSAAALTGRPGRDAERAVALHRRAFLAGGPVHGAGFGLLVGALGLAGRRSGELPAGVTGAALGAAVPNLLSPLYLVTEPAAWLIPIGRFPGLILAGVAGTRLAR